MAQEIEPREYQDTPIEDLPDAMAEEALETPSEELAEHTIPKALQKIIDSDDILADLSEDDVTEIQLRVTEGYDLDWQTMEDYVDRYEQIIQLAAMDEELGDKTFPFIGASKVMLPQLSKAAVEFNSRTVPEVVNRKDIANVKVWGQQSELKNAIAERRSLAINWQLKKGIKGWSERMDRALLLLPVAGMIFKKKWWDDGKICEALITADMMVYDHDAESFDDAPRKSHWFYVDANVYESYVRTGYYAPIEELENQKKDGKQQKVDKPLKLIESHCTLDLDHDGYSEPYIVTFYEPSKQVVKIQRRFNEPDVFTDDGQVVRIEGEEFFTQSGFLPSLKKPAVYIGWGDLLFDLLKALNTMMRQMIDAGTLNNTAMNSGFISSSAQAPGRSKSGRLELVLGQLTKVDVGAGQSLKDMIWTPQFTGVSQGFYQLLQELKTEIDQYTSASQSMNVSAGEAATLYLARLQQSLKVPNAITSRVYGSLTKEFERIDDLMKRYMPEEKYKGIINWHPKVPPSVKAQYEQAMTQYQAMAEQAMAMGMQFPLQPPDDPQAVAEMGITKKGDFAEAFDIITTADPTLGNEQERIAKAEIVATRAQTVQGVYNVYETEKKFLEAIGAIDIDKMLPEPTNEPDPMMMAQVRWTNADAARMESEAKEREAGTQLKLANAASVAVKTDLEERKTEATIDKTVAETMKVLSDIDANDAKIEMGALDIATKHMEQNLEERRQYLEAAQNPVIAGHAEMGDITEDDIQTTMQAHGMSREQVLNALSQQDEVQDGA
jgi:hypothetical protein